MKLETLDRLRSERDDVDNAPMIAIRQALGCRVVAETVRRYVKER